MIDNDISFLTASHHVILVDQFDKEVGYCEKLEAHKKGLLHRAFSIFIINDDGKMLLQKRSKIKYHSAGLWTNACCSHPGPQQSIIESASVRLPLEMGFECDIQLVDHLLYKHSFKNGLIEHEYDHILLGYYSGNVNPNPLEASAYKWCSFEDIELALQKDEKSFTFWFKHALPKLKFHLKHLNIA
ncbi:isopentenyl-diphosphate Delta-isomerase [Arcticibacter eurypsychrophilus]|uniref:isopentenyl-diphosphate Delta-isomerase n=1 Tax=Arcticibacter eurypsychrophilus TaxID=1434752 RepID=UPI00084CF3B8|nr:isopentenyl-diphosphate Delta-isomerase [Arcticibacter eurypsychrophilus]